VDPICPLLTLDGDPRAVSSSPDVAHRCSAGGTLATIDREYQARFCLSGRYQSCERYAAHLEAGGAVGPRWKAGAADATFASTRLVVDTAPRTVAGARPRRIGRAALFVIGLVLAGVVIGWIGLGGLGAILGPGGASPTPSASASASASPSETPEPSPSVEESASASPETTPAPSTTPAPTPVTYIVQAGDTLNEIAARFGTTAQAIMQANGLTSDVINVGQVLIIPI
jgi:hypothetical protein